MSLRTHVQAVLALSVCALAGCAVDGTGSSTGRAAQAVDCPDLGFVACDVHDAQADCTVSPGALLFDQYVVNVSWADGSTTQFTAPAKVTGKSDRGTLVTLSSDQFYGVWSFDDAPTGTQSTSTLGAKYITPAPTTCAYPVCKGVVLCVDKPPTGPN